MDAGGVRGKGRVQSHRQDGCSQYLSHLPESNRSAKTATRYRCASSLSISDGGIDLTRFRGDVQSHRQDGCRAGAGVDQQQNRVEWNSGEGEGGVRSTRGSGRYIDAGVDQRP